MIHIGNINKDTDSLIDIFHIYGLGLAVGDTEAVGLGFAVGLVVGLFVGLAVGLVFGFRVGEAVASSVGLGVGVGVFKITLTPSSGTGETILFLPVASQAIITINNRTAKPAAI
jgi:hypothetical protein